MERSKPKPAAGHGYNERMNCPICKQPLERHEKSLVCGNRHSFDISRQGYVNLSRKQKKGGDNAAMSQARTAFLETGAYDFLRQALVDKIRSLNPEVLVDLGCGEGYYTSQIGPLARQSYGIDLSVSSIRHAAVRDKSTQYVVDTIYELPFDDGSVSLCTSIFTPIPAHEISRVLKEDGYLLTVSPGKMHHYELKEQLYDKVRLNDEPVHPAGFELVDQKEIERQVHVEDVWSLLEMTPYRYTSPQSGLERIRNLKDGLTITFDFVISLWRTQKHESKN